MAEPAAPTRAEAGEPDTPPPELVELAAQVRAGLVPLAREMRRTEGEFTPTQLSVIGAIHRHEPISLGDLASRERLSPAMISRVVAKLVEAGMVERLLDDDDRRVCRVRMSQAGNRWIDKGRAQRDAWLAQRLARLDDAELVALRAAVPVLEHLAQDHD